MSETIAAPSTGASLFASILDPTLFRPFEKLCQDAISFSGNHSSVRQTLTDIYHSYSEAAVSRLGHITPEVIALGNLLRRTDPKVVESNADRPAPQQDPLELLLKYRQLDLDRYNAALTIRRIWKGFGRYLVVAGRAPMLGAAKGSKSKVLGPIDVMGVRLLNEWRECYVPWFNAAKLRRVGPETHAGVIIRTVVEDYPHKQLEKSLSLKRGTVIRVMQDELLSFASRHKRFEETYQESV